MRDDAFAHLCHRRPPRRPGRGARPDVCYRRRDRRPRRPAHRLFARRDRGAGAAHLRHPRRARRGPDRERRRPHRRRRDAGAAATQPRPLLRQRAPSRRAGARESDPVDPFVFRPHGVRHRRRLGHRARPNVACAGRRQERRSCAARGHGARRPRRAPPGPRVRAAGRDMERRRTVLPQRRRTPARR